MGPGQVVTPFLEFEEPLAELLDKWSPPLLVAYRYPSASCGPKAQGVEEVCIVHRWPLNPEP